MASDEGYCYLLFGDATLEMKEASADRLLVFTHEGEPVAVPN